MGQRPTVEHRFSSRPEKIAILGGGIGSLSTAFELTDEPGWQERYEITIYQQGFRLGGKCASSRRSDAQDRIEEHGVHVWMGVYENAFRMIRKCYSELARDDKEPLATWQQAFAPHHDITLEERTDDGWRHWNVRFPGNARTPGDGDAQLLTAGEYVQMAVALLSQLVADIGPTPDQKPDPEQRPEQGRGPLAALAIVAAWSGAVGGALPALLSAAKGLPSALRSGRIDDVLSLVARVGEALLGAGLGPDVARRLRVVLGLASAVLRGIVADDLLASGFSSIDDEDLGDWLRRHGASELAADSAIVRGFYDLAIAYRDGNSGRPRMAAGAALRSGLRMLLTSKGALFYKMQAGMGEAVIVPLYEVLRRRGVRFEFFHRVERLVPAADGQSIGEILVGRQATLKRGPYQPLIRAAGLDCWPAEPLYDQLVEGEALAAGGVDLESSWSDWRDVELRRLVAGVDFDRVVLGIPVSALGTICADLAAARSDWRDMLTNIGSVATQAAQLWLEPDARGLGWRGPSTIADAYAPPFSIWADLSHLIERESWPAAHRPRSNAYLCGPLEDPAAPPSPLDTHYPARAKAQARQNLERWLDRHAAHLWPGAATGDEAEGQRFDYSLLVDPMGRRGSARLEAQYVRANINPSDRYILSLPGTTQYRMRCDASGYRNLVLAGDWVKTGIDLGCVEATVLSGCQAARAITGRWRFFAGEDDLRDAPRTPPMAMSRSMPGGRAWSPASPAAPMSTPDPRPAYVERGGEQTICHPVLFSSVQVRAFMLRADSARLAEMCDRHFVQPSGGRVQVRPAAPCVALVVAEIGRARSTVEPHRGIGWASEIDVGFWVPVWHSLRGSSEKERLAFYHPYLFVDSEYAVASGREIYGFHKLLGTFDIPAIGDDTRPISVDSMVVHPRGARGLSQRVLEVRRTDARGPGSDGPQPRSTVTEGFAGGMAGAMAGGLISTLAQMIPGFDARLSRTLAGTESSMIFLKQFRDSSDGKRACYQAIVEAPARLTNTRSLGPMGGQYEVSINAYDSHPIARDLGLAQGPLKSVVALQADFDFVMEAGRELFRAGGTNEEERAPEEPRAPRIMQAL